jgi:hypothetical protein
MKPIFRCEYCDKLGTEEEITKHEAECIYNHTKKSCFTCKHAENKIIKFVCKLGKDIPEGKLFEYCPEYEWDEKEFAIRTASPFSNIFGGIF